jgi:hypothetical protein
VSGGQCALTKSTPKPTAALVSEIGRCLKALALGLVTEINRVPAYSAINSTRGRPPHRTARTAEMANKAESSSAPRRPLPGNYMAGTTLAGSTRYGMGCCRRIPYSPGKTKQNMRRS